MRGVVVLITVCEVRRPTLLLLCGIVHDVRFEKWPILCIRGIALHIAQTVLLYVSVSWCDLRDDHQMTRMTHSFRRGFKTNPLEAV